MNTAARHDPEMSRPQLYGGFGGFARPPYSQPTAYGAAPIDVGKASGFFARTQRQRLNVVPICQCFLLPWLLFCAVFAAVSFELHFTSPGLCWAVVGLALLAVALTAGCAAIGAWRKYRSAGAGNYSAFGVDAGAAHPPTWVTFLALSFLAAWVLAVVLGNMNFWTNMQPYYDYHNLNSHTSINPARMRGQEFMDAGRVLFTNNSVLDLRRSIGFRNLDTYCVAPITIRSEDQGTLLSLESYDFWAVGLDCCQTHAADFHCGEFDNPQARQGLRLLRDDQRQFFRLAVQQAEATYSIKADHPLFFYWVSDAGAEVQTFRDDGYRYFLIGMLVHFAWQLLCVTLAIFAFAKLGHL
mmetsp:Transcript_52285/g.150605  ORF Transcript_52285/g.150605 Transcript_52285/m.150605 type:complete len:354 (-) Transcript_52285:85-1146(-)